MRLRLLGALALGTVALIGCGSDDGDVDTPSDDSVITDDSVLVDDSIAVNSTTGDGSSTETSMP